MDNVMNSNKATWLGVGKKHCGLALKICAFALFKKIKIEMSE